VGATLDTLLAETDSLAADVARSQGLLASAERQQAAAKRTRRLAGLTAGASHAMAFAGGPAAKGGAWTPPLTPHAAASPSADLQLPPPSEARQAAQGHLQDARRLLHSLRMQTYVA